MSARKAVREKSYEEEAQRYTWIVYLVAMLLVGGLAGYLLSISGPRSVRAVATLPAATTGAGADAGLVDEVALRAYRDILARDPRNVPAADGAANMLYDAHRYEEAIGFYQQAMTANGADVNVSTDLGTALWYTGRADAALAQYAVSLTIVPNHAQTLFNMGIVKADGKKDYAGAIKAWETLLATSPAYPNAARVRDLIADASSRSSATN